MMERAREKLAEVDAISVDSDGAVTLTPDKMGEPEPADEFGPGGDDDEVGDDEE